jgi:hypothetical protein
MGLLRVQRRAVRYHALAYGFVVALLAALDWWLGPPIWAHWVLLGWGIGLGVHAWCVLTGRCLRG